MNTLKCKLTIFPYFSHSACLDDDEILDAIETYLAQDRTFHNPIIVEKVHRYLNKYLMYINYEGTFEVYFDDF
jgi:hypothetical protein